MAGYTVESLPPLPFAGPWDNVPMPEFTEAHLAIYWDAESGAWVEVLST